MKSKRTSLFWVAAFAIAFPVLVFFAVLNLDQLYQLTYWSAYWAK